MQNLVPVFSGRLPVSPCSQIGRESQKLLRCRHLLHFSQFSPCFSLKSPCFGANNRETGSYLTAHTTIQSFQTADFRADSKEAVSVGIFAGIVPLFRSLVTLAVSQADFSLPSLQQKIPFPAAEFGAANRRRLENLAFRKAELPIQATFYCCFDCHRR
jgi:hypothetical protein